MKTLFLILIILVYGCSVPIEINYCEEYANADKINIKFENSTKYYSFNNITIEEKTLLRSCENG